MASEGAEVCLPGGAPGVGATEIQLVFPVGFPKVAHVSDPPSRAHCLASETLLRQASAEARGSLERYLESRAEPALRRLALRLAGLRDRARGRLGAAETLFLSPKGLEQASSSAVASWRIATLDRREPSGMPLTDLTAGLGIDALAASARRLVIAQELDPETATLCTLNSERHAPNAVLTVRGDASRPGTRTPLVALDPDRRPEGRRELDPTRWSPDWATVTERLSEARGGWVKLTPSVDARALEASLPTNLARSWSFVARGRELAEATLWTGVLADGDPAEAVVIEPDGTPRARLSGERHDPPSALTTDLAAGARWIVEPHPAVLRAGLVQALLDDVAPLGPRLGFLAPTDPGAPPPASTTLAAVWRVLDSTSADPKRVRRMLADHDRGPVRVLVRGHPESGDELARRFRGKGSRPAVVLVARLERGHRAYLVEES